MPSEIHHNAKNCSSAQCAASDMVTKAYREEAFGPGWQEHFVDSKQASATVSVGSAVSKSLSYITIPKFASPEECTTLQESALDIQNGNSEGSHILFASQGNFNCNRYSVKALLNRGAVATSAAFMDRLLGILEGNGDHTGSESEELSDLSQHVFGANSNLGKMKAVWYEEPDDKGQLQPEPKVNIYKEGGYFKRHGDGMDLTLLVVLSDAFEGGGTAFFRDPDQEQHREGAESVDSAEPAIIAKPPAGTAMIWGGMLQHMALPVTKGMRAVYVGSFDLKESDPN